MYLVKSTNYEAPNYAVLLEPLGSLNEQYVDMKQGWVK
jgi:hypothetical protein